MTSRPSSAPPDRGFYFFDPDGNLLQLYAPPKTQPAS